MNERMNICISASNKYIELGAITLYSVVKNGYESTKYNFFIIDNGINEENKVNVKQLFENHDVEVYFVNSNDIEKDSGLNINAGRWTLSTLQRLYISEILPKSIKKVLYLDCDMLVRKPLDELYCIDLKDEFIVAAVPDCLSAQNKHNIGLNENDLCINAGMLLIDIEKWRKFNVGQKGITFLSNNIKHLQFFDQDILNFVLNGHIRELPLKFNSYTLLFNYTYKEILRYRNVKYFCDFQNYSEAKDDPTIVHFTQDTISIRPWYINGNHKYRNEWLQIREQTPWGKFELWSDDRPKSMKIKNTIFKLLPRSFSVMIASIINNRHAFKYK